MGGISSEKAAYVPGGKEICGCSSIILDNPKCWFLLGHLGAHMGGGNMMMSGSLIPSSWQEIAAPSPTCPPPRAAASTGSMAPTARQPWKISTSWAPSWEGTSLGRGGQGMSGAGALLAWECVLIRAGTGLEGGGMWWGWKDG